MASRRASLGLTEYARIVLHGVALGVALVGDDGRMCFTVTAAVTVASIGLQLLGGPRFVRLSIVWQLAFLHIIVREAFLDPGPAIALGGYDEFNLACRYVCACNAMVLMMHALVFREGEVQRFPLEPHVFTSVQIRRTWNFLLAGFIFFCATWIPMTIVMFRGGRAALDEGNSALAVQTVGLAIFTGTSAIIGIFLPALFGFYWVRMLRHGMGAAVLVALPVFAVEFLTGTRFFLLFSVSSLLVVLLGHERITVRRALFGMGVALLLGATSAIVTRFRQTGFSGVEFSSFTGSDDADKPLINHEGVLLYLSALIGYCRQHGYMYGASTANIFLFWIPRAVWPTKLTFIGYWFPRAIGLEGYSGSFSAALGFAGDAYVDFGFAGGVAFFALFGMAFGRIERWVARMLAARDNAWVVLAGGLFGAAFFGVRSPDTSVVILTGCWVCVRIFHFGLALPPAIAQ